MATEMPPAPPAPAFTRFQIAGALGAVGGLLTMLGAFLPWLTATAPFVGSISRSGIDGGGDGMLFVALGVGLIALGGGVAFARDSRRRLHLALGLFLGALGGAALLYQEFQTVGDRVSSATAASNLIVAGTGSGLYAIAVGLALAAIGALVAEA